MMNDTKEVSNSMRSDARNVCLALNYPLKFVSGNFYVHATVGGTSRKVMKSCVRPEGIILSGRAEERRR